MCCCIIFNETICVETVRTFFHERIIYLLIYAAAAAAVWFAFVGKWSQTVDCQDLYAYIHRVSTHFRLHLDSAIYSGSVRLVSSRQFNNKN